MDSPPIPAVEEITAASMVDNHVDLDDIQSGESPSTKFESKQCRPEDQFNGISLIKANSPQANDIFYVSLAKMLCYLQDGRRKGQSHLQCS